MAEKTVPTKSVFEIAQNASAARRLELEALIDKLNADPKQGAVYSFYQAEAGPRLVADLKPSAPRTR